MRKMKLISINIVMLSLLIACQSSDNPSTSSDITPAPSSTVNGCNLAEGQPGESVALTLVHGSVTRSYQLHLHTNYDCTPRPLIIGFHGYYGSGRGFEEDTSEMFSTIDERGYIGVFPDGLQMGASGWQADVTSFNDIDSHNSTGPDGPTCTDTSYDYGVYDNCPVDEATDACNWGTSCADDEGFVHALIEHVKTHWTIDADRIYITGFSQGGQTAQSLAWRLSDVIAAAAPQHGFSANGYTVAPLTPIGLFQVWGNTDRIVDGHDTASNDGMIYDGAEETALVWAEGLGCDLTPTTYATPYDGTQGWNCMQHANCPSGKEVVTCVWDGGHRWGTTGGTNFALLSMLDFFERHNRSQ